MQGGGIGLSGADGQLQAVNSVFVHNNAQNGAGIFVEQCVPPLVLLHGVHWLSCTLRGKASLAGSTQPMQSQTGGHGRLLFVNQCASRMLRVHARVSTRTRKSAKQPGA